jgi:hypothetical protein
MTDQKPEDDVVRMDRVQMFIDRPLWFFVLMTPVQGVLALIRSEPEPVVVVTEDDVEEPRFSLPLSQVRYCGRPSAPMGIRAVADTGFRLDFGGKRKILLFTGQSAETTAEQQKALMDVQMGRLQGDLDPVSLVKSMITAGRALRDMPGQLRRGKEAREAWEHLLTGDARGPKPSRARAAPSRRRPAARQPAERGHRKPADAALSARTAGTRTSRSTKAAVNMPKPTDRDRERFRSLVPQAPSVTVKPLFGNLSAFVNGNMFMGLFGSDIGLKLPPHEQATLLAEPGSGPFGPAERPRGGYVTIPATWSTDEAGPWIEKSLALVAALPPKKPKERAKTS